MPELPASELWGSLRLVPSLGLLWLAYLFGRTLRAGAIPLVQQIARCGTPALSPALCRYTRRLTGIWCAYFVLVAAAVAMSNASGANAYGWMSLAVWSSTAALFVGERWLRPWFFPGEPFPTLRQQLRDTWSIWRPQGGASSDARR